MGTLENKTWEEAQVMHGRQLEEYLDDWYHSSLPTMESAQTMTDRVIKALEQIISDGKDTLIIAHNGTLTIILWYLGLIGKKELTDMSFGFQFGCYSSIRIDKNGVCLEGLNI